MNSFEDFCKKHELKRNLDYVELAFEAGQQSRQAEVDDHIQRRMELTKDKQDLLKERDELKKRNEQAIAFIEHWYGCMELSNIVDILNGDMKWESKQ